MKCSRDGSNMKEVDIDGVKVDICEQCAAVWFDQFEFQKFDEVQEQRGDKLIQILEGIKKASVDLEKRISCPKCSDTVLMRRFASPLKKIAVDECPGCGGFWLDAGEITEYRKLFPTEADRKKIGKEFSEKTIGPMLKQAAQQSQDELAKAQKVANIFRFVCPSYYIPGKQAGGAF